MAYWGELPAPKIVRGDSFKARGGAQKTKGNHDLSINTDMAGGRSPGPGQVNRAQPRQDRYSTQTATDNSPFTSPLGSEFRPEGLAPRPSSFQAGATDPAYNKDFSERRKRRESRNRDSYEAPSSRPLPTASDPSRPPPASYKAPNSHAQSSNQAGRSRSARRSEGPVSPRRGSSGDNYGANTGQEYQQGDEEEFRTRRLQPSNGKGAVGYPANQRAVAERFESNTSQPRKGSVSEAEAERRRAWAADRSPLQRLELTLDSITKEEKRARVEEAELLLKDEQAGRGAEKTQNSVRFRNRPVAKAPEPGTIVPQSSIENDSVRDSGTRRKDQPRRDTTSEEQAFAGNTRGLQSNTQSGLNHPYRTDEDVVIPQRGSSTRSKIPVALAGGAAAVGLARRESNKLRKQPPPQVVAEAWARLAGEDQPTDTNIERKTSTRSGHQPVTVAKPFKNATIRTVPQSLDVRKHSVLDEHRLTHFQDKELPRLPRDTSNSRMESVTNGNYAAPGGQTDVSRVLSTRQPGNQAQTISKNDSQNVVKSDPDAYRSYPQQDSREQHHHHRIPKLLDHFHHPNSHNEGVYRPSPRLDEWKKGGIALLAGPLLDLDVSDENGQSEKEKDKAWWEAGNTGVRRRSTSAPRKAEAFDGEYDDSNSMHSLSTPPPSVECEGCHSERLCGEIARNMRSPHNTFNEKTDAVRDLVENADGLPLTTPLLKPHLLTCSVRSIRLRPEIAPTKFKPPLFLKSGPMLRYCGLRRDNVKSRSKRETLPDREIWRGSIMIVTEDAHSSYELAPTLRLFLQPVNLLPPPPAQLDGEVDELAPEYVDPIAGLPRIGRDGRTLYIKPVEHLEEVKDLSTEESDDGLFEAQRTPMDGAADRKTTCPKPHYDGEKAGKFKEVRGFRLHAEQGVTFWRFNVEVELREKQQRIAYRINRGPATAFWVPARDQAMNIMFYSCNGFSHGVDPDLFCGPDPLWRDVLNTHQTQPFHVMLGGGDQLSFPSNRDSKILTFVRRIYNDLVMEKAALFREWSFMKDPFHKERHPWTQEMQAELEKFYLDRYCMWFSQGLFGVAASQIPMINIFDDHDIIDGFGSYSTKYMESPVFSGLGEVAFKFYMLFQHQSSIDEGEETEPAWILGTQPGPYIKQLSRTIFTSLGRSIAFLGLDCRTERMNDEIVSAETYHKVFDRLSADIVKGEVKHLIVMVGVPVAYPRMVWLENILTSRAMEPVKALGRAGILGKGLLNKMDGGVEILDDLDDHWTARHHKDERNWFIQELQDLAAEKSVRVTVLGGDVHLAAIGQFYSNPKLGIAKDHDFRYMPNIISSAIVNTPPPDTLADILNRRNKVHHMDAETDEDMIPIFTHDVNGKPRNNKRLLNRRNWCSIRPYNPDLSPPPTPQTDGPPSPPPQKMGLLRRLSGSRGPSYRPDVARSNTTGFPRRGPADAPPLSSPGFFAKQGQAQGTPPRRGSTDSRRSGFLTRTLSLSRKDFMPSGLFRRNSNKGRHSGGINGYGSETESDEEEERAYNSQPRIAPTGLRGGGNDNDYNDDESYFPAMPPATGHVSQHPVDLAPTSVAGRPAQQGFVAPTRNKFHRTPTGLSEKQIRQGGVQDINLEGGLDICLNVEVNQKDPAGITMPYRLLVPALWYDESMDRLIEVKPKTSGGLKRWTSLTKGKGKTAE